MQKTLFKTSTKNKKEEKKQMKKSFILETLVSIKSQV